MAENAVPLSDDITRVYNLPSRDWFETEQGRQQAEALAVWLTNLLRLPDTYCDRCGEARKHKDTCGYLPHQRPPLALRAVQAVILWEYYILRGVYAQVPVGGGKTLITWLAAFVLSALRPLLLLPAALIDDTHDKFEVYSRYWVTPRPIPTLESYQQITQVGSVDLLGAREPDCLMGDECDKAKDQGRSTFKRINRFMNEINRTEHRCASGWLSGSNVRTSLADDAHFATWALGPRSPSPKADKALQDWCAALDEDRKVGNARLHPGALLHFADQAGVPVFDYSIPEIGMLDRAREGYRLRFARTPGVVIYDTSECDQPLTIDFVRAVDDPVLEGTFEQFRLTGETPDGILLPDPLQRDRHEQQLGCGFYYYWDPRPPIEWLMARKEWHMFVRSEIENTSRLARGHLDTEMAVANAYPDNPWLLQWRAVKHLFKPEDNTVFKFITYSVVQQAAREAAYMHKHGPCIVWVKNEAFGQALAALTGWPFFAERGEQMDPNGRPYKSQTVEKMIRDTRADKLPVAILSFDSNHRGRNLQAYCNALFVGWEKSGPRTEQALGREHRSGQSRAVHARVLLTSARTVNHFEGTKAEAKFAKSRGLTQKILNASVDERNLYDANDFLTSRWHKPVSEE